MSSKMMKSPSRTRSTPGKKKNNPSLMKVFSYKGEKEDGTPDTVPNTPEEEFGVTVVAKEIDPTRNLSSLMRQQVPSPLRAGHRPVRGDHRSFSSKNSGTREEKEQQLANPSKDATVDHVVRKTLNFLDDVCAVPVPQIASASGAQGVSGVTMQNHLQLQAHMASYTAAHLYDTTTSQSSARSTNKPPRIPTSQSHDHENFEVVLDPASYKEEQASASGKQPKKRWPRLSKNLSASLSSSSPKESSINRNPKSLENNKAGFERSKSPAPRTRADDAPMDEEAGRLGESEQEEPVDVQEDAEKAKQSKFSSKPKVLGKKIWKFKKIPIRKGDSHQHRADVDTETAVARQNLQLTKSLEDQEFLQHESPKEDVEPIMENDKSEADAANEGSYERAPEEPIVDNSSMAKAWNNIFTSIAGTSDPEADGTRTKSILNESNGISMLEPSREEDDDEASKSHEEKTNDANQLRKEEALASAVQSVEVSSADKKYSSRASLGNRLKKFQKSAYFIKSKKASKKSSQSNAANPSVSESSSSTPTASVAEPTTTAAQLPQKPKLVWKAVVDPATGRTYYYHRKTRETTWTKPDGFKRYELEYKKWLEANSALTTTMAEFVDTKEETKEEEKASSTKALSASWPHDGRSGELAKDEKKMARSPTEPTEQISLQMLDESGVSPAAEEKADAVQEEKKEENEPEVKEAKASKGKTDKKKSSNESEPFDEEKPFDEPLPKQELGLLFLPRSPARFSRNMTYMSKASARSALTDRTEKIKNTGKGKFSAFNAITENMSSATSISSHDRFGRGMPPTSRIPSRVPVHRERQLMVEDLTDARISAESYEGTSGEKPGRIVKSRARKEVNSSRDYYETNNELIEDYGASTFDTDTYGTDSVSALSENDTDFLSRRDNFDQARRRALDAAIEVEDWDLAAALSDGMRAVNTPGGYEKAHSSWNQSELDKFIANNDWNAVKSYIARMRERSKKQEGAKGQTANKRIGSRSQMQHTDVMSESSWSGSESESSYETYDSESRM